MSTASGKRIAEVLEEKSDLTNPENPDKDITDGSIDFENVVFRYSSNSEKPVLENINLHINSG
jgi:ATP-binding cassette subfamily B protein